jgi:hypothetical protein
MLHFLHATTLVGRPSRTSNPRKSRMGSWHPRAGPNEPMVIQADVFCKCQAARQPAQGRHPDRQLRRQFRRGKQISERGAANHRFPVE